MMDLKCAQKANNIFIITQRKFNKNVFMKQSEIDKGGKR
jgi:hypothetical protein